MEQTRARILDAVVAILARDVAELSVQAVARESGISRPTIYRHFRSKREMIDAVGEAYEKKLGVDPETFPRDLDSMLQHVPEVFARSESVDDSFRAAVWSTAARGASQRRARARRLEEMRALLAPATRGMSQDDLERLARVATVLCSSSTRRAFHDLIGLGPADAASCVTWAIRRLVGGER